MESPEAPRATAPAVSARILVVDDDPACLRSWERALRRPDRVVVAAASGQEALAEAGRHDLDLVVLDFALGNGMNGDEVLRRLRAQPRTRDVPVIIVSGEAAGKDFQNCFDLGANECFNKPVSVVILRRKAEDLIKTRRPAPPAAPRLLDKGDVVLLEADEYQADLARSWLEGAGFSVRRASGAAEFWAALDRLPDCVVMDLNLGLEDGTAVCAAVKRLPRTQAIPIVVYTARAELKAEAYEHQAVCVIEKGSVAERELPRAVAAVIEQQRRAHGIVDLGAVRLNSPESTVYHRGARVATLDHGPFAILMRLVMASPAPVSDEELRQAAAVRPPYQRRGGADLPPRTLPTYIYNLRQQLGAELGSRIRRVNGSGYVYVAP